MRGCYLALAFLFLLPPAYSDDGAAVAILHTQGNVLLDGQPALSSSAIFPNSLIETKKNGFAAITLSGSRIEITEETVVTFSGDELILEHGSLSVLTFNEMAVKVGCLDVIPVSYEETRYDISDRSGRVIVNALKKDVSIKSKSQNSKKEAAAAHLREIVVREGEQKSREEKCGAGMNASGARAAATGDLLNSPYAVAAGAAGILGTLCWTFCPSGAPASPSVP